MSRSGPATVSRSRPILPKKIGCRNQAVLPDPNTLLRHAGPVAADDPEYRLTLRQADQAREDFTLILDE